VFQGSLKISASRQVTVTAFQYGGLPIENLPLSYQQKYLKFHGRLHTNLLADEIRAVFMKEPTTHFCLLVFQIGDPKTQSPEEYEGERIIVSELLRHHGKRKFSDCHFNS
jgi:hypothetical protein